MNNDLVNGLFELGGAFLILLNVRALMRDKEIKGTHWGPVIFFTAWGFWNLWYYPSLNQWFSFAGGVAITVVNVWWLFLLWRYTR